MKFFATLIIAGALAACTPPPAPATGPAPEPGSTAQPGQPAPSAQDMQTLAADARRATVPDAPRQVNFGWELDEAGARFQGRGVARYEAPRRSRLDLFGPRGETYLAAALVDGEPRVPPGLMGRFQLPSPALLWGAVGVIEPPAGARLLEASNRGAVTTLRYQAGDDVIEYRAEGGRLQSVRRRRGSAVAESIDLTYNDQGLSRAQYRDWAAYRSLNLTIESSTDVLQFPEDTWRPAGT
ncbi:hypothetical protein [Longimicrobium sp.]|uniref:hypothetical protein n=1 Tax=Longimicrobium sp. TaxID=2029185 RepID=UPI003B3B1F12